MGTLAKARPAPLSPLPQRQSANKCQWLVLPRTPLRACSCALLCRRLDTDCKHALRRTHLVSHMPSTAHTTPPRRLPVKAGRRAPDNWRAHADVTPIPNGTQSGPWRKRPATPPHSLQGRTAHRCSPARRPSTPRGTTSTSRPFPGTDKTSHVRCDCVMGKTTVEVVRRVQGLIAEKGCRRRHLILC